MFIRSTSVRYGSHARDKPKALLFKGTSMLVQLGFVRLNKSVWREKFQTACWMYKRDSKNLFPSRLQLMWQWRRIWDYLIPKLVLVQREAAGRTSQFQAATVRYAHSDLALSQLIGMTKTLSTGHIARFPAPVLMHKKHTFFLLNPIDWQRGADIIVWSWAS